jgi:hypothetical protein
VIRKWVAVGLLPGRFELSRREIAECRMNALCAIHIVDKSTNLRFRIRKVALLCQRDLLFLCRSLISSGV